MRACSARVSPGGGIRTVIMAVSDYSTGRNWSPKGIIFVDGKASADDWIIRPAECNGFVGAIAFRETPDGCEMVAFRRDQGYCFRFRAIGSIVTLNRHERMIVRMSGSRVLEWALPLMLE